MKSLVTPYIAYEAFVFTPRRLIEIATMATPTRTANVGLYRKLLRAAQEFGQYNTRDYAVRYVRDDFRAAAVLTGQEVWLLRLRPSGTISCGRPPMSQALNAFQHGMAQLEMLSRQSSISRMFKGEERHAARLLQ